MTNSEGMERSGGNEVFPSQRSGMRGAAKATVIEIKTLQVWQVKNSLGESTRQQRIACQLDLLEALKFSNGARNSARDEIVVQLHLLNKLPFSNGCWDLKTCIKGGFFNQPAS